MARQVGFLDLNSFNDWQRFPAVEEYSQIDSLGYIVHIWCKFPKFGFQRISDMACRMVRDGALLKEQAQLMIKDFDYILDKAAKRDFCDTLGLSEEYFDKIVERHINHDLLVKDLNGQWKRKDCV